MFWQPDQSQEITIPKTVSISLNKMVSYLAITT